MKNMKSTQKLSEKITILMRIHSLNNQNLERSLDASSIIENFEKKVWIFFKSTISHSNFRRQTRLLTHWYSILEASHPLIDDAVIEIWDISSLEVDFTPKKQEISETSRILIASHLLNEWRRQDEVIKVRKIVCFSTFTAVFTSKSQEMYEISHESARFLHCRSSSRNRSFLDFHICFHIRIAGDLRDFSRKCSNFLRKCSISAL